MSEVKKTIEEWSNHFGIEVLEPDGFDRTDPELYSRTFTREEFLKGLLSSTIIAKADFFRLMANSDPEGDGFI